MKIYFYQNSKLVLKILIKFHFIFIIFYFILFVIDSISEKENYLKDLVIKLLRERNLSNFDMLDSLFTELKHELENQQKNTN
ncbi:hypothetical protein C6990_01715 [Nitrosopumilus sp. b3]|nr:hypothetical protein C6990_01715 [Nitrosopumilus sp. b3]